jgi:hypothetical protein
MQPMLQDLSATQKRAAMGNSEPPRKHPTKLYLMSFMLLFLSGDWLAQYVKYGYVTNPKEQNVYYGRDGLAVSLAILMVGLVFLSGALWSSYKVHISRKKDDT